MKAYMETGGAFSHEYLENCTVESVQADAAKRMIDRMALDPDDAQLLLDVLGLA